MTGRWCKQTCLHEVSITSASTERCSHSIKSAVWLCSCSIYHTQ